MEKTGVGKGKERKLNTTKNDEEVGKRGRRKSTDAAMMTLLDRA